MHQDDLWQAFDINGARADTTGYRAYNGNPDLGDDAFVGTVSLWLYRYNDGEIEILFQQRSPKVTNGGKWDVSAGGHINNNEDNISAMVREAREEIGAKIDPSKLEFIFRIRSLHNKQMFNNFYIYDWGKHSSNFKFDDGEVSQVKWVKLSEFDDFVDKNTKDVIKNNQFTRTMTKFWLERKQSDGNITQ